MSFVLDASVAVAWAFADASFLQTKPALDQVQRSFARSPVHLDIEIANALRKATREGRIFHAERVRFHAFYSSLDVRPEPYPPRILTLLSLADQFSLSAYDAAYLDLAIRLSIPLATLDDNVAKAARKAGVPLLIKT